MMMTIMMMMMTMRMKVELLVSWLLVEEVEEVLKDLGEKVIFLSFQKEESVIPIWPTYWQLLSMLLFLLPQIWLEA
jgi:hypothetical protein